VDTYNSCYSYYVGLVVDV